MTEQTTQPPDGDEQREPDLVLVILRRVVEMNPTIDPETVLAIEQEIRLLYGGRRYFLPKRKKHPTAEQRRAVLRDGMTDMPTPEIENRHGVDRSTLYRYMKRLPGRRE